MEWLTGFLTWRLRKLGKATEGLPTLANLQQQLDDVTRERDEALTRVDILQAELARLKPAELMEMGEAGHILMVLFDHGREVSRHELMRTADWGMGLKESNAMYHLDRLIEEEYVRRKGGRYSLTAKGRAFVVENDLDYWGRGIHQRLQYRCLIPARAARRYASEAKRLRQAA